MDFASRRVPCPSRSGYLAARPMAPGRHAARSLAPTRAAVPGPALRPPLCCPASTSLTAAPRSSGHSGIQGVCVECSAQGKASEHSRPLLPAPPSELPPALSKCHSQPGGTRPGRGWIGRPAPAWTVKTSPRSLRSAQVWGCTQLPRRPQPSRSLCPPQS